MSAGRLMIAAGAALLVPAVAAAADTGAVARISGYNDAILTTMKQRLPLKARADRFENIVGTYYDMSAIAQLVIGPGWTTASAAERGAVTAALARHSAVSLASNFVKFGGERFLVDPKVQERGDNRLVKVTIASPGGSDTLYFRMRPAAGGSWKIIDVISGGVSQLAVQRADLAATASAGLPAVAKRLSELDAKTLAGR